jgi:hypothetical protein
MNRRACCNSVGAATNALRSILAARLVVSMVPASPARHRATGAQIDAYVRDATFHDVIGKRRREQRAKQADENGGGGGVIGASCRSRSAKLSAGPSDPGDAPRFMTMHAIKMFDKTHTQLGVSGPELFVIH